ncbi:hypothetical protein U369_23745 [Bacillus anthracis 52-G]|nr:hypothetical protein U365_21530 [Bacillus anthracis 9080-G]EVU03015.1 hypothetical protein U369_23745 [Bacillus anthracis 52-G]EXJ18519.1 hypothetical protein Y693_23465 [Bacillus anthracis str. 95014]
MLYLLCTFQLDMWFEKLVVLNKCVLGGILVFVYKRMNWHEKMK